MRTFFVAVGGVLGSVSRYWIGGLVQRSSNVDFPWGTLAVNVLGCFVLGLIMTLSLERGVIGPNLRIGLSIGFCGGFTTMSTFGYETLALLRNGDTGLALGNIVMTILAGLVAVWFGALMARTI